MTPIQLEEEQALQTYLTGVASVTSIATLGNVAVGSNGTERFDLIDTGRIEALNQAFSGSDIGQCNVRNYGIMIGEVMIGDLDDSLLNRGFNDGTICMGDGNDTFTVRGIVGDIIMLGTGNDDYCGTQAPFPISA